VEAQFNLLHIDDEQTRFHLFIAHLEPQYASKVDDVIKRPRIGNLTSISKLR